MKNIRIKDIPSFVRTTDISEIMFDFLGSEAQNHLNSSAIVFNTFNEFEYEVLEEISAMFPRIYNIGARAKQPIQVLMFKLMERRF